MKKVGLTDTVLVEMSRKFRVERVKLCVFRGFVLARKSAFDAYKKWKKISRWCVGGSGYHIKLDLTIFYLLGPYGPRKQRLSYVNFFLDFGNGIVLEKGL